MEQGAWIWLFSCWFFVEMGQTFCLQFCRLEVPFQHYVCYNRIITLQKTNQTKQINGQKMRGVLGAHFVGISLDGYCIFLFCLHWRVHLDLLPCSRVSCWLTVYPFPLCFHYLFSSPTTPACLPLPQLPWKWGCCWPLYGTPVVRTDIHNCAICSLAQTRLVELWCLSLRCSVHPKGHLLLHCWKIRSGLIWHQPLLLLPWGLNCGRAAIFEGLKWEPNTYPLSSLFIYSCQVIALLRRDSMDFSEKKGLRLLYIDAVNV